MDPRSAGPAQLQRAVEGFRDQVRLRLPRTLEFYQRHVRPRLGGDARHIELSDWAQRGVDILGRLGTHGIRFDRDGIWIDDGDGAMWSYTPGLFGSALWAEYGAAYEQAEIALLTRVLPADATMIDIGANIGMHSIKLIQRVEGLRVFAFEPIGSTIAALRRNAIRNGVGDQLQASQIAISDHEGEIRVTVGFRAGNFVVPDGAALVDGQAEVVPTKTLDAAIEEIEPHRVDLVKCDVEGHELAVVRGAAATLDRYRPMVFVEVMERLTQRYGHPARDVFDLLATHGYGYQSVVEGQLVPASASVAPDLKRTTNFLFTHRDGPVST